ncbi:hypothetical protein DFR29_12026 [Tahibacter aquaticus]|uniref:Protein argonaute n=1 Tax=Tahibacter aquaticus TaxID=520092 RepID=A0A4R6YMJ2_9GAMM|nr:hypothetical protein [Tahibacter aquaticus]TDR38525.1 hypothetical protein DFR29_12026 [Tahibacter aquaticus]
MMKVKVLKEPLLEFGNGTHICPRTGIETLGVYDKRDELRRSELRIGIVGRGEGVDLLDEWLDHCKRGIPSKVDNKFPNLFKGFGGISEHYGFFTRLLSSPQYTRTLQKSEINKIAKITSREDRVVKCVDLYYEQARFISENRSVDVIICVVPNDLFDSLTKSSGAEDTELVDRYMEHNFRRLLKARCMHLGIPLQLVREKTILSVKPSIDQQDLATKAWNFCTALYYKGNRTVPWRLVEDKFKPRTCYIGIGFYKSRDGETISTSLAQVFDEFGHGVILRGAPVSIDKNDRHPYMEEGQAHDLLHSALAEYENALMQKPARVVIHKSSRFRDTEIAGFSQVLDAKGIATRDFVSITSTDIRLFSAKEYPPARGTLLSLTEREGVLYTKGIVEFYKTYPGMYIPSPLRIEMFDSDSSLEDIAKEILGLTKMNWNNTQLDGRLPITLECANKVGDIMKYVDASQKPQVSFSFYM